MYIYLALAIPFFPLLSFLLLTWRRKEWKEEVVSMIGVAATLGSMLLSFYFLIHNAITAKTLSWAIPWFKFGQKVVHFQVELTRLNLLMLVIVSVVSFLVFLYSKGYMKDDVRFSTFYAYLSLFTASMLGLVISANLLQMYLFWEMVGFSSFLLIGFWYFKPEAKAAARKAFIVTRIGDVGLFLAICFIYAKIGDFSLDALRSAVSTHAIAPSMITAIAILIFIGAVGKSGQFPLHSWLPDAMEGPTPVSALIHAATMVAAGVYLVANLFFLFAASPTAMSVVAYTGGFTAIFAATIALTQNDIKRVLAYSTVSQLGYMMLALGSAGYVAGVFHLFTHAAFKALLFLGAGSVIISLYHEQDIRKMGGLWKRHSWLGISFLIGCLSIAGIPPFSGFFSKDEIFVTTFLSGRKDLFVLALLTAFCTAFYMFRLFFKVFLGSYKGNKESKEVSWTMSSPVLILAGLATVLGFLNFPKEFLGHWLTRGLSLPQEAIGPLWIPFVAILTALLGIGLAYSMYVREWISSTRLRERISFVYQVVHHKYYMDEIYIRILLWPLKGLSWLLHGVDRFVVGGVVKLTSNLFQGIGQTSARLQNGQAQWYALVSVIGFVLLFVGLTAGRLLK